MTPGKQTEFIVTAQSGRPLSSFRDAQMASDFRTERARHKVRTWLFEVLTETKELP